MHCMTPIILELSLNKQNNLHMYTCTWYNSLLIEKASITILADPIQDIQSSTATVAVSLQKQ